MRQPAFRKSIRGHQVSQQKSLPAPTGGWNVRDSVADMDIKDAVTMENWFPETTDVRIRKGVANHVTGIGAQVESLMQYNKPDGTQTLFAAAGTAIYNATSAGAVGAAVVSGQTNARWQHVNFTNSSGTSYLCNFNGADSPQYWNGSAWITVTGVSSPAITGLTTSTIIAATSHKRRMWLVQKDSLKVWYLPVDSVGGAAKAFDFAGVCKRGGFVMAMETWTLDSGEGIDDLLVVITSEGQVVVSKGTDPSSISSWSVIGVWDIGEPLGRRCMIKYRGDVLLACVDGVYALSSALIGSQTDPEMALTYKINKQMTDVAVLYGANYGWQLLHYPKGNQLFLNVPIAEGSTQQQYAMNTITRSWAQFTKMEANCWVIFNEEAYFGNNGNVVKFGGDVYADNSNDIVGLLKQAFSYFGSKGRLKQFKEMRPNFLIGNLDESLSLDAQVGIDVDFGDDPLSGSLVIQPIAPGSWDSGVWDTTTWGGDVARVNDWLTVHGIGTSASVKIKVTSQSDLRLQSSDHVFEYGGVIG